MDKLERVARLFHEAYERNAPKFGYETREDTREFNLSSPNGRLMIAVCGEVLSALEPVTVQEAARVLLEDSERIGCQKSPEPVLDWHQACLRATGSSRDD